MALDYSDWAAQGDEDSSFDKAPFDHAGARSKLTARIARTIRQLNGEKVAPQGGKDFETLHNNGVHYKPTLNDKPIVLPGLPNGVRADRVKLQEKLKGFAADVDAGHFDDQLEKVFAGGGRPAPAKTGKGGAGKPRKSGLPDRGDNLPHRVPADQEQPHDSYTLNKAKTYWRSPEQVEDDDKRAKQRAAAIAKKKS